MTHNIKTEASDRSELLHKCDNLIEQGSIGNARDILLHLLESCNDSKELDMIIEKANTIKALEIIEECFKKKEKKTMEYAKSLEEEIGKIGEENEKNLEMLLGKFV
jgi:hypothetical protein